MGTADRHDLARFVDAQAPVYDAVLDELRAGHKRGHWMWFIFPQLAGLGRSEAARWYGIRSLDEARAYLDHEVLGPRLRECAALVSAHDTTAEAIFGPVDAMKLRSSMTLFGLAAADAGIFDRVIERYFDGRPDDLTLERSGQQD